MSNEENIVYYRNIKKVYNKDNILISRDCSECKEHLLVENFPETSSKSYKDGIRGKCKECTRKWFSDYEKENESKLRKYRQDYYEKNKEVINKKGRVYRENNKEKMSVNHKKWRKENKDHLKRYREKWNEENREHLNLYKTIHTAKRRALIRKLPFDLDSDSWDEILLKFNYKCPLTGSEEISLEHFIPLSTGHGGTTIANCYPLEQGLNASKQGRNPFKWVESKIKDGDIELEDWNNLVLYLANMNGLTFSEYKDFVDWCFNNKRDTKEILDDTSSIEIWINERGLQ